MLFLLMEISSYLDPVVDLNVIIGRVEMKSLRLITVLHLVTAWQLYVEFHFSRTNCRVAREITQ